MSSLIKHYSDIPYSLIIKLSADKHYTEVAIFAIAARDPETDEPSDWIKISTPSDDFVSFEEASEIINGTIGKDGCSDWKLEPDPSVCTHFCGIKGINNFTEILKRSFELSMELMK